MSITGSMAAAVSGLHASALRFSVAANNIVNAATPGFKAHQVRTMTLVSGGLAACATSPGGSLATAVGGGQVDLVSQFVEMVQARTSYAANAKVIVSVEEMTGRLLDIEA